MILLANIMIGIANVLHIVLWLVFWLVLIRAIISWFSPDPRNTLVRIITSATEPLLMPIRRRLPAWGGFDWSVLVVILLTHFLRPVLVGSLLEYAQLIKTAAG